MAANVKIPLDDVTLSEASGLVDDASFWQNTLAPVVYFYKMAPSEYWELRVGDHRVLVEWLETSGLVKHGDSA